MSGRLTAAGAGITLIELLVALGIASFLLLGTLQVFVNARAASRAGEIVARLQENARFALAALEPDVRMASYFGLTSRPHLIAGRAGPAEPPSVVPPAGDCGPNWSVDLDRPIAGVNNVWRWTCTPYGRRIDGSDSFVIRRAAGAAASPPFAAGTVYVQSVRMGEGRLFVGAAPPGTGSAVSAIHELSVSGYYVSENSALDAPGNAVPSLRRKVLRGLRVLDEEVMPGVEDLQIQLGIDTDAPAAAGRGAIDRFVNADDPILDPASPAYVPTANILALRVWLRVRSEIPERGFTDRRIYRYADRNFVPTGEQARFRRLLVVKTIYLRNAHSAF